MRNLKSLLDEIQSEFRAGHRRFTEHAILEASDDDLTITDVVEAILDISAEIIEDYQEEGRGSCLISGRAASRIVVHAVVSYPPDAAVITVYRPDPKRWLSYRKRKRQPKGR